MSFSSLRKELQQYYWYEADTKADQFNQKCTALLDTQYHEGLSSYEMKLLQYRTIVDSMEPVLFGNAPFYFETGTMCSTTDGSYEWSKQATNDSPKVVHRHPGGWTYLKNEHLFKEQDPDLWKLRCAQGNEQLYLICGPYNDVMQHFNLNPRPILKDGFCGVYMQAKAELARATDEKERTFLHTVCEGMLQIKRIAEKFAARAEQLYAQTDNPEYKKNFRLIADTAKIVPWEKPRSFYEALNTLAFHRKIVGALEGIGPNTFGRVDMDLYPFYQADIASGKLTEQKAYDLICQFLLLFDCCYDHNKTMEGYADHELENTYTLGGCDSSGVPLYNDLTRLFLTATREEQIIFPKIKCRYSANSPKEYLDDINKAVIAGTSTIIYVNDDAVLPARLHAGRSLTEARDYIVSGCWGLHDNGFGKHDDGNYLNLLKVLEFSVYKQPEKEKNIGITFQPFDQAASFEEVYQIYCRNALSLIKERLRVGRLGGQIWEQVSPLPIFSSTHGDCIKNHKDFTGGGDRYHDDFLAFFGFGNVVDSLMAIKQMVFERGCCSLQELLSAVRSNWEGKEELRQIALHCNGWGDGSDAAGNFAAQLQNDLSEMLEGCTGVYGGRVFASHYGYTEIRFWGEHTLATPDGRHHGEYITQGLTPSRLKKISSVTDVIRHMAMLPRETLAGGSVINIILPSAKTDAAVCEAFLRATAHSSICSLQLNCLSKEQLLDAQKHPENYPHLIVRVCGFSAKFTALSPEWQQEVISRNFYES